MERNNISLKRLPSGVSKKELVEMYIKNRMSEAEILTAINTIIYDNRKDKKHWRGLTKSQIIAAKSVQPVELTEFVETFGLPDGYYSPKYD